MPMQIRVIWRCFWIYCRSIAASQREPEMVKKGLLQFWSEYHRGVISEKTRRIIRLGMHFPEILSGGGRPVRTLTESV